MSETLSIFQVDAFTENVFGSHPAAVVPLEYWLPDPLLQNIAAENNLSETAFIVREDPGDEFDCCSRYFASHAVIDEDPVTGSAHCTIVPYWAERLGKNTLICQQASKRGGTLYCTFLGEAVALYQQIGFVKVNPPDQNPDIKLDYYEFEFKNMAR